METQHTAASKEAAKRRRDEHMRISQKIATQPQELAHALGSLFDANEPAAAPPPPPAPPLPPGVQDVAPPPPPSYASTAADGHGRRSQFKNARPFKVPRSSAPVVM